jgi:hypothetical protein
MRGTVNGGRDALRSAVDNGYPRTYSLDMAESIEISKKADILKIEDKIKEIDFTMGMEDMPLTEEDRRVLRDCMTGKSDVHEVLRKTIEQYTVPA